MLLSVVRIPETSDASELLDAAERALAVLAARPGFVRGRAGRATDAGGGWVLVTEWESVGAWRRALSSYEVKVAATGLLALGRNEPSAFEVLLSREGSAPIEKVASDRYEDGPFRPGSS